VSAPEPIAPPPPPDATPPWPIRIGRRATRRTADACRAAARRTAAAATWIWRRRPPAPRQAALLFAAAVATLGGWSVVFQATLPDRLPRPLDWAAVSALLERDARPGDAVAPSPAWAERARLAAPAAIPVLAFPGFASEDLVGVRRVWLLSLHGAPGFQWRPEIDLLDRAAGADPPLALGQIEAARYDLAPALPLAFLPDRISTAAVLVGDERCAAEGATAFRCPGEPGVRVSREVRDVAGLPRPCLVATANPVPGAPLSVVFSDVPIGRALRVHAAPAAPPPPGAAPIRLAVQLDGEEVGAAEVAPGGARWAPLSIDTTRHAGRARAVTFVVTAAGPSAAPVCFDAVALP
jgi:hypothetical protein